MEGVYSYRNQAWFDILAPKDEDIELSGAWDELIDDEYQAMGQARFETLIQTKQHQYVPKSQGCAFDLIIVSQRSFELRLKRTSSNSTLQEEPMWVILSIFPELSDDGEVVEIIGCFTDIRYVPFRAKWLVISPKFFTACGVHSCDTRPVGNLVFWSSRRISPSTREIEILIHLTRVRIVRLQLQ
jgi:hypothetical protein